MRIPTLVGIAIILSLIGSLFYWFFIKEKPQPLVNIEVSDMETVNITDTTATVVWQTNLPVVGTVNYGQSENLGQSASDNRDLSAAKEKFTHFVTIKNLTPNTKYYYKLLNAGVSPPEQAAEFTTANIPPQEDLDFSFIKPLKGTVLNTTLNPIDEALIFLEIEGAQKLATFSSTSGNFVMPLKLVLNTELNKIFHVPDNTPATLLFKKGKIQSRVKVLISDSNVNLPPVTIGSNLDLSKYKHNEILPIIIGAQPTGGLDYNRDGTVNSLDLAILRSKAGASSSLTAEERATYDLNSDGLVDRKDVSQFSTTILNSGN